MRGQHGHGDDEAQIEEYHSTSDTQSPFKYVSLINAQLVCLSFYFLIGLLEDTRIVLHKRTTE